MTLLKHKGEMFLEGIGDRVKESLHIIETKYSNFEQLENAVTFITYHHSDAVKAEIEQISRVGYFPAIEVEMELDHAMKHALIGSYKAAFADLRRGLELTLTSVYLTSDQSDREKAVEWIKSLTSTPFFSRMLSALKKEGRFKELNDSSGWVDSLLQLYWALSDYSHTKGRLKSYRTLNVPGKYIYGTSVLKINEDTLITFCDFYLQVVEEIVVMLALYNPMILVGVPIGRKFPIIEFAPASGFYTHHQAALIHMLIPDRYKGYFEQVVKDDEEVREGLKYFDSLPDMIDD